MVSQVAKRTKKRRTVFSPRSVFLLLFLLLTACGGGGTGSPLDGNVGGGDGEVIPSFSAQTSDGTSIENVALSFDSATQVTLRLTDSAGNGLPNETLTYSLDIPVSSTTTQKVVASGTTTTDANGRAVVTLVLNDPTLTGTGTLTVTATSLGESQTYTVTVAAAAGVPAYIGLELEDIDTGLAATGVDPDRGVRVAVEVLDAAGDPVPGNTLVEVAEEAGIGVISGAGDNSRITVVDGVGSFTFDAGESTANGAVVFLASLEVTDQADAIYLLEAELVTSFLTSGGSTATPAAVEFVSTSVSSLAIGGTGSAVRPDEADLIFRVLDSNGLGISGQTVNFSVSSQIGGISLDVNSTTTNADGEAAVTVSAGSANAVFTVAASVTVGSTTLSDISTELLVSGGAPAAGRFSIGATVSNPGGADVNGVTSEIVVIVNDLFGRSVADGTTILFLPEYGSLEENSCEVLNGTCSVTWVSGEPRSPQFGAAPDVKTLLNTSCSKTDAESSNPVISTGVPCADSLGQSLGGRTTIFAYVLGDEAFNISGNGQFDAGETFVDLGEPFIDHNGDGLFGNPDYAGACTSGVAAACSGWMTGGEEEVFIDTNGNNQYDGPNGIYNGALCSDAALAANACSREPVHISASTEVLMSGSTPYAGLHDAAGDYFSSGVVDVSAGAETVQLWISDRFNGRLPIDSNVTVTTTNCELINAVDVTVGNSNDEGFHVIPLQLAPDTNGEALGFINVEIEVPELGGNTLTTYSFGCLDESSGGTGGTGTGTTTDAAIGLALTYGLGAATTTVTDVDPGTLTITLTNAAGDTLLDQEVVSVTTTVGSLSPASGLVLTDVNGEATITVNDGGDEGAGTLTVTYGDVEETFNFQIVQTGAGGGGGGDEPTLGLDLRVGGMSSRSISSANPGELVITLQDANSDPIANEVVNVSTNIGQLDPSSGNVLTDATGEARVDVLVGGASVGEAGTLTVEYEGVTATFNFEIVSSGSGGEAGVPVDFDPNPYLEDPDNPGVAITSISATDPARVVVTVVDSAGDPVSGQIVNVSSEFGVVDLTPEWGNILTDTNGVATINVEVGNGQPGEAERLIVTLGDIEESVEFEVVDSGTASNSGLQLELELFNSTTDPLEETTTINTVEPGLLRATLTNIASGLPVVGRIITIETIVGSPDITPASGQILTDSNGEAEVTVEVGSSEPGAAIQLRASVADLEPTIEFSVGSANIALGFEDDGNYSTLETIAGNLNQLDVGNGTNSFSGLSATGTTPLTVAVYNNATGALVTTPVVVNFEVSCASASVDTAVTTVNGVARSTFAADANCAGQDVTVTASLADLGGSLATGTISVADTTVNSIRFVSADPTTLVIAGTGGDETANVVFEVVDNTGAVKPNVSVDFSLSTAVGGLSLDNTSADLNSQGRVTATVNAGSIPTTVQVVATVDLGGGNSVSTVSNTLVVSTGLPDQDSFSLSASVLNPGGGDLDGVETELTIRASDAFNNPVPDNTAILFRSEYGQMDSKCRTVDGACSLTWTSAGGSTVVDQLTGDFRTIEAGNLTGCPGVYPGSGPCLNVATFPEEQLYSGRNTVLATTLGEESFVDANGSGLYDWIDLDNDGLYEPGDGETLEVFEDLPEAFLDENEDGVFGNSLTQGACTSAAPGVCADWVTGGAEDVHVESFPDSISGNGEYDQGNGIYNGRLCHPVLEAANQCTTDPILVRDSLVIVMSGQAPYLSLRDSGTGAQHDLDADLTGGGSETVVLYASDYQNGLLPSGTTVTVENDNCNIAGVSSYTVPNSNNPGFTTFNITVTPDDTLGETGTVVISVTTPDAVGGITSSTSFTCRD